jgi:trk system potassium uptake protein TrkH
MQEDINLIKSYSPKPGDKVFRIPRTKTLRIVVSGIKRRRTPGISLWSLIYGFAGMILTGTLLLMCPISSSTGQWSSILTSLFTATSSVCVTGLVVVDTLDHWSFFGQIVILILIQLGGLGFMTSTTLLLMATGRKIGLRERLLISESAGIAGIRGVVKLTRNIILFTLIVEVLGAIVFSLRFLPEFGLKTGIWKSIFQSVSSFNNAGFDLFGGFRSLSGFQNDYLVLLCTAGLIILGGISFIAIHNTLKSKKISRTTSDTKIVLLITTLLLGFGTLITLIFEFNNPLTLGPMSLSDKILNAFFQSVTSRTAGFNVINIGSVTLISLIAIMVLMFIGGASGSTAGGIKVNTLGLIVATVWNTLRGRENPGAFGREFNLQQVFRAMALLVISLGLIMMVFLILSITEDFPSLKVLFETISAFGTVGLTTGITPELSSIGQLVIILTMFMGRLGPLTLAMALTKAHHTSKYHYPKENIRIG